MTSRNCDVRNSGLLKVAVCLLAAAVMMTNFLSCSTRDPKFQQYMAEGEQLYATHCSNCHQKNGEGLRLVYPPLASSDYMEKNFSRVICGMKYGLDGEVVVNGNAYNQLMPGVLSLTELEIAEIATYIYNSWGHQRGIIESRSVPDLLDSCVRPGPRR